MKTARTLGSRRQRPLGVPGPPTPAERAWMARMAQRRTRVPKGIFRYRSMAQANADWERWHAEMVAEDVSTG